MLLSVEKGGLHGEAYKVGVQTTFSLNEQGFIFSPHSPYAPPILMGINHHQEGMHAKVKVLKRSPQTFLAGMHAQLRPIGGRSEPG